MSRLSLLAGLVLAAVALLVVPAGAKAPARPSHAVIKRLLAKQYTYEKGLYDIKERWTAKKIAYGRARPSGTARRAPAARSSNLAP